MNSLPFAWTANPWTLFEELDDQTRIRQVDTIAINILRHVILHSTLCFDIRLFAFVKRSSSPFGGTLAEEYSIPVDAKSLRLTLDVLCGIELLTRVGVNSYQWVGDARSVSFTQSLLSRQTLRNVSSYPPVPAIILPRPMMHVNLATALDDIKRSDSVLTLPPSPRRTIDCDFMGIRAASPSTSDRPSTGNLRPRGSSHCELCHDQFLPEELDSDSEMCFPCYLHDKHSVLE